MPRIPRPDSDRRSHKKKVAMVILPGDPGAKVVPKLPDSRKWHPSTESWWADVWASPMSHELVHADAHGLLRVATLTDDFATAETPKDRAALAGEIRLSGALFGLDPTSRRRLGWRVEAPKVENAVMRHLRSGRDDGPDDRDYLRDQ